MTLGTMESKTTSAPEHPPVTIIQQSEDNGHFGGGKKSRVTRKHVIIGVTCAVVVAMVITGILIGVKFYLDSANEIVTRTFEFRQKNDKKMKEDVSVDVKDNYVQYHVKDDDSEVWVIEDFNRELQVMKVTHPAGTKCFVATLNSSDSALPQAVLNATATDEILEEHDTYYEVSKTSIKDTSMLGRHSQKQCENLHVHWLIQICSADKNSTTSAVSSNEQTRQKRDLRDLLEIPDPDLGLSRRRFCFCYRCLKCLCFRCLSFGCFWGWCCSCLW